MLLQAANSGVVHFCNGGRAFQSEGNIFLRLKGRFLPTVTITDWPSLKDPDTFQRIFRPQIWPHDQIYLANLFFEKICYI